MITRREWIAAAVAARLAVAKAGPARVGVQMYTVRDLIKKDAEGTLREIAGIGYHAVEGGHAELTALKPLLDQYKLATPSAMIDTALVTGNWSAWKKTDASVKEIGWDEELESIKKLGAKFAVVPYLLPGVERGMTEDFYRQFAEKMNAAGERCNKAGLTFCYHNHAFEFRPMSRWRPIDLMLANFDPKLVKFEMDAFWVSTSGNDPVEFLKTHAGRIALVHLKDKAADTPVRFDEAVQRDKFKEIGSGVLDWRAILKAASDAGVEGYFVEQDQTPGNPLDSLRKSHEYLRSLKAKEIELE